MALETRDTGPTSTRTATPAADVRFNPFSAEFRRNPYELYRQLRELKPVHKTMGMWVLTRYADVRAVLRDRSFSVGLIPQLVSRQADRLSHDNVTRIQRLGEKSLVFTDDPEHARLRGLVNHVFTPRAISELRPRISAVAHQLIERARHDGGMDAIADFAAPLPIRVMCDWMALPDSLREHVGHWTHDVRFLLEPGLMKADRFARVSDVVEAFAGALDEVIAERRRRRGDDLVSRLLNVEAPGGDKLSTEEVIFVCMMSFVAGNETTKSLIGNGLLALLQHPAQAARLHGRRDHLKSAVSETLRYDSPLQLTKRLATRDVQVGGERIHEGEQVLLCLGAANRDPAAFSRPDEFDIGRQRAHLAFGHGMHGCLGGPLAELQAQVAFEHLYEAGNRVELLTERLVWQDHSFILRGLKRLPISLQGSR